MFIFFRDNDLFRIGRNVRNFTLCLLEANGNIRRFVVSISHEITYLGFLRILKMLKSGGIL